MYNELYKMNNENRKAPEELNISRPGFKESVQI